MHGTPDLPTAAPRGSGWLSRALQDGRLAAAVKQAVRTAELETIDDPLLACVLGRKPASPPGLGEWAAAVAGEGPPRDATLDRGIEVSALPARTRKLLLSSGTPTLRELVTRTETDLLRLQGFGRKDLYAVKEALGELGLALGTTLGRVLPKLAPDDAWPLYELELSVGTSNALSDAGIETVGALVLMTEAELGEIEGMERKRVREVVALLAELGLALADENDPE